MRIKNSRCQGHTKGETGFVHGGLLGRLLVVDEETFQRFTNALEEKPTSNRRLRRLLVRESPWELLNPEIRARIIE
jgi:hypothetical protein